MLSESRWKRERIENYKTSQGHYNDDYYRDNTTNMSYEESPLTKVLMGTLIAGASIGAYKSGLLKGAAKHILEYADTRTFAGAEAIKTFKNYLINDDNVPLRSIVRNAPSLKQLVNNEDYRNEVYKDTISDVKGFIDKLKENVGRVKRETADFKERTYTHTDLMYDIGGVNSTNSALQRNTGIDTTNFLKEASQSLVENRSITDEIIETQKERRGYSELRLGDVFDTNGEKLIDKNPNFSMDYDSRKKLEDFLNNEIEINGQKTTILKSNMFKNMTFDKNIMIDERGKIIDLRKTNDAFREFTKSLANDFKIPILDINPFAMFDAERLYVKDINYGVLWPNTVQGFVTNTAGRETVAQTISKKPLVFINGNVFKFGKNSELEKVAENKKLINLAKSIKNIGSSRSGMSREANAYRKFLDLGFIQITGEYANKGNFKYYYSKLMNFMGIGMQDAKVRMAPSIFDPSTYPGYIYQFLNNPKNKHIKGTFEEIKNKLRPYETWKEHDLLQVFGTIPDTESEHFFVAVNKPKKQKYTGKTFNDFINYSKNRARGIGKSLFAGRHDLENVSEITTVPYYLMERLNATLSTLGLGLPNRDLGSAGSTFKNLMLKRFLPIYVGYNTLVDIGYMTEYEDKEGKKHNIYTGLTNAKDHVSIGFNKIRDTLHITPHMKRLRELMPGAEQITDIPGFRWLDMSKSAEEREYDRNKGMTAVRKGRYWSLGGTPYTGGKIEYWIPNKSRQIRSDYKFTNTLYGSREEYLKNSAIPSLSHPFSPIRHFITDKYHYELKHFNDRPYLYTSPAFENVPLIGPLLSRTVGRILKPVRKMHTEYLKDSENAERISKGKGSKLPYVFAEGSIKQRKIGELTEADLSDFDLNLDDEVAAEEENVSVYQTKSGGMKLVDLKNQDIKKVKRELKDYSMKRVEGTKLLNYKAKGEVFKDIDSPFSFSSTFSDEFKVASDVAGIYGFGMTGFVTGNPGTNSKRIETSGYAYSMNRAFWDENLGGFGGDLSEIYRRFLPRRRKDIEWYNPVKNNQASWLPSSDYFVDLQHGDIFSKLNIGEIRLPSEAYEKIWNIDDPMALRIGSSFIGKGTDEIVKHFLKQDVITDPNLIETLDKGNRIHKHFERQWLRDGTAIDVEGEIKDPKHNIIGYYDARVIDETSPTGEAIVDIKTVNPKKFKSLRKPIEANMRQLNYYLYATQNEKGYLYYVNSEDTTKTKVFKVKYSRRMLKQTFEDLENARNIVRQGLESGTIGRGDLYEYIDRFRILADVAPYSNEFKEVSAVVSKMDLTPEEEFEIKDIKKRLKEQKEPLRIYPYKFRNAKVNYETVHVTEVIDANTFRVKEYDNPIKLAGVRVSNDKSNEDAVKARKKVKHFIHKGATLKIGVDADPLNLVSKDSRHTIRAVVYKNLTNVNRYILKNNLGKEQVNDNSSAGVHARYTNGQIRFGSVWERISHTNSIINTKLLQVRSAVEDYERSEIYGERFQSWTSPVKDFLKPAFNQAVNGPYGLLTGLVVGIMFGARGNFWKNRYSRYGKIVGGTIGVSVVAAGKLYKHFYEAKNNSKWIPKERREERELNEYTDMLKYLKYRRLFEEYAHESLKKEGFDVKAFMEEEKNKGEARQGRIDKLQRIKDNIKDNGLTHDNKKLLKEAKGKYVDKMKDEDEVLHAINKEINEIKNYRDVKTLPPLALKAIDYNNRSNQTLYAYDKGEPIENILAALPKKDRQYMKYFLKAKGKERLRILSVVPRYVRRPLESAWGIPVEDKPNIVEYFKSHQLPGPEWAGWKENTDIDAVKVKLIKKQGLEFEEFNLWNNDIELANQAGQIPIPKINYRDNEATVRSKLYDLLHGVGVQDIRIDTYNTSKDATFDLDLKEDKRKEIEDYIKNFKI